MFFDAITRESFLSRYQQGPAILRQAWNEVPAEAQTWRPGAGKWSAHEVVIHCADSETYAAIRIRLLLAEAEPLIVGYDENIWARRFDYLASDPELALQLVGTVRGHTSAMLARMPEEAWGRMVGTPTVVPTGRMTGCAAMANTWRSTPLRSGEPWRRGSVDKP